METLSLTVFSLQGYFKQKISLNEILHKERLIKMSKTKLKKHTVQFLN